MKRWGLDVTCEEGRAPVGIDTQRHWSDRASERSMPLLFGLVAFCGQALHPDGDIPLAHTAWSGKRAATFCEVLALLRRHLWGQGTFPTAPTARDVLFVP